MHQIDHAPEMCAFGYEVMDLAREHGIKTQVALIKSLHAHGYFISDKTMNSYLYGTDTVHPSFPVNLANALCLSESEKYRLANAYTYGQASYGKVDTVAS